DRGRGPDCGPARGPLHGGPAVQAGGGGGCSPPPGASQAHGLKEPTRASNNATPPRPARFVKRNDPARGGCRKATLGYLEFSPMKLHMPPGPRASCMMAEVVEASVSLGIGGPAKLKAG